VKCPAASEIVDAISLFSMGGKVTVGESGVRAVAEVLVRLKLLEAVSASCREEHCIYERHGDRRKA